jgi:glycosyltransferase A (GT-A) superfamily protein (DUF2064 family)
VSVAVVVLAKAPIPGLAKTRLARTEGAGRASHLAAAALLDTLEVCGAVSPAGLRVLALAGDLSAASRAPELAGALDGWHLIGQGTGALGERVRDAIHETHRLTGGPVMLVGMDTPHLQARVLADVAGRVESTGGPVLGPAVDGGWWLLAVDDPRHADGVASVSMSRPDTCARTRDAVCRAAGPPAPAPVTRDVDTAADAAWAAALAPATRFAQVWHGGREPAGRPGGRDTAGRPGGRGTAGRMAGTATRSGAAR